MDGQTAKAKRYGDRAEDLKSIAEKMPDDSTKRILLSLAVEYEQLAKHFTRTGVAE